MNSARPRILTVAGARPNFMKVAPILRELDRRGGFESRLVHTGQHYDVSMSDAFFAELGIPEPDHNLGVGSGSHGAQTGEILTKIEQVLIEERPALVIVVGDVNGTLAAALAAAKLGIPVAHVEAGLRSFDRAMPEEINRVLTDAISDLCFTTEPVANENLLREGVAAERVHFVGNVMIDTLLAHLEAARARDVAGQYGLERRRYAVLTLHRPSNVDDPERLRALFRTLEAVHRRIDVVFPAHPRTQGAIARQLGGRAPQLRLIPPMGYFDFLGLVSGAALVLTDSGGIQEETTALDIPCLTLRDNTERPVTIAQGTNTLVGSDPEAIQAHVAAILRGDAKRGRMPELWDGKAAGRIVDVLAESLVAREEFTP